MKFNLKFVAGLAMLLFTVALCSAYPRAVFLEVFTNYG